MTEAVIVLEGEHRGTYIHKASLKPQTIVEMVFGYSRIKHDNPDMLPVVFAEDDQWAFVIGLCVCGLAKRVNL